MLLLALAPTVPIPSSSSNGMTQKRDQRDKRFGQAFTMELRLQLQGGRPRPNSFNVHTSTLSFCQYFREKRNRVLPLPPPVPSPPRRLFSGGYMGAGRRRIFWVEVHKHPAASCDASFFSFRIRQCRPRLLPFGRKRGRGLGRIKFWGSSAAEKFTTSPTVQRCDPPGFG